MHIPSEHSYDILAGQSTRIEDEEGDISRKLLDLCLSYQASGHMRKSREISDVPVNGSTHRRHVVGSTNGNSQPYVTYDLPLLTFLAERGIFGSTAERLLSRVLDAQKQASSPSSGRAVEENEDLDAVRTLLGRLLPLRHISANPKTFVLLA